MERIFLCGGNAALKRMYGADVVIYTQEMLMAEPEKFKDTKYVFSSWGMPKLTEEEIRQYLPNLQAVFYCAGSVRGWARPYMNCGAKVFSAWAANAIPVSEYTSSLILLSNKGFFKAANYTNYKASRAISRYQNPGNFDVKVGIVGAGMIGKLVIERLRSSRIEVLVFDPFLPDEKADQLGVKKVSLEELFSQCHVVSNHLANNEQTKGMLNGALFEKLEPYATFINSGRGAQVVEEDLIRVLQERPDLTAILDVTQSDPPEEGSPLYTLENCILTPHIAGSFNHEERRMAEYMEQEYQRFLKNEPCKYEVTLEMLKTMA